MYTAGFYSAQAEWRRVSGENQVGVSGVQTGFCRCWEGVGLKGGFWRLPRAARGLWEPLKRDWGLNMAFAHVLYR